MNPPPYHNYPKIASEELLLRKILPDEISQITSISFYNGKQANSTHEAARMLQKIEQDYAAGNSVHWGIEEKATGKLLGTCGYYRGFKDATGELGCVLLPDARGRGIMTSALRLAISFGFRSLKLEKITAFTTSKNHNALRLFERLDFRKSSNAAQPAFYLLRKDFFRIRDYNLKDQEEVLHLLRLNIPEYFHPSEEKHLKHYLEKEAKNYFVVQGLGTILAAGGYNLGFDEGKTVRLSWDLVHPQFQQLGLGRQLTRHRIAEIKTAAAVENIVVRTTPQAKKFYEKMGFQKEHFEKDFWAPGFDLCQMGMLLK